MASALEELDRRLTALDEAIVLLRQDDPDQDQLMAAVVSASSGILEAAGEHRAYVSARLLTIMITNGLATADATPRPVRG